MKYYHMTYTQCCSTFACGDFTQRYAVPVASIPDLPSCARFKCAWVDNVENGEGLGANITWGGCWGGHWVVRGPLASTTSM